MGSLAALFGNSEEKPQQDSEKLMDLYWNRAELKKSFADARKEHYRLEDKIKQQEGAIARIQQKLDHLEDLLIDPQWVHNVVVCYQLRGLAQRCERTLAKFSEELKQQREQKKHSSMMSGWNAQLAEESAQIEEQLVVHRHLMQQIEDQILAGRERLESMSLFARIFKGRSVKVSLRQFEQQISTARTAESSLLGKLVDVKDRTPPENRGLGVSSKRSINLMILAFAQQLYLQFSDREFATLVKESGEKSVGSVNYGNQYECTQILERINECVEIMEQGSDFANILRQRATLISKQAEFRNKTDVVPVAASTATLFDIDDEGLVQERKAEILGENYWGIAKVLSR